jgi:hypothetical protein
VKGFLIITSIAGPDNPVLMQFAKESTEYNVLFIVIGDSKSPENFILEGCDYYPVDRQQSLTWNLVKMLPLNHYSRKNIGYLEAISRGADIIIETDDDNFPLAQFWNDRNETANANTLYNMGWVNVYKYFVDKHIWPRGFALEHIHDNVPAIKEKRDILCPIQQGLAEENPDVDAIYRLTLPLPVTFDRKANIALGENSICPFNSQNTTWFKQAFPLLYLPSFCSFRMTDIWRSYIAQRIAWTCGWSILFHPFNVVQVRNNHNLIHDLNDEFVGYTNNLRIVENLKALKLKNGRENILNNMVICYKVFIEMGLIDVSEIDLLEAWFTDIQPFM